MSSTNNELPGPDARPGIEDPLSPATREFRIGRDIARGARQHSDGWARPRCGFVRIDRSSRVKRITPLMRAAITSDFCNGVSSVLNFDEWTFINADLTISLARMPVGEWILLDAQTWLGDHGAGLAFAKLGDERGYFGRAIQSLVIDNALSNRLRSEAGSPPPSSAPPRRARCGSSRSPCRTPPRSPASARP